MKTLKNRTALVTGAASGIGKAIALQLAEEGADVAVNFLNQEDKATEVVSQITSKGVRTGKFRADISREEEVLKMFDEVNGRFGQLDILINNAGRQKDSEFQNMSLADWNAVVNVDLTGHFLCAREAVKLFLGQNPDNGDGFHPSIVFITSVHQSIPWAKRANYNAAKAGAAMLMKTIAQEMAPHGIRANAIAPGAVKTAINIENFRDPGEKEKILRKIPYGRPGKVSDIARAAVWLASGEADYITGETIYVDGGMELYADFAHGG
ncbi:MAG: SDR family oxidoreductase [Bacteroidales bacterium]